MTQELSRTSSPINSPIVHRYRSKTNRGKSFLIKPSNHSLSVSQTTTPPNIHQFITNPLTMSLIRRGDVFDPFSPDLWDPFDSFPFRAGSPFGAGSGSIFPRTTSDTAAFAGARIDWKETPEAHVFKADVPGLKKEEVKVEVDDGNVLQISGERNKEREETSGTWHRVERSSGKFLRRFRLPDNAKTEHIKASMENGVLTVTVPNEEAKRHDVKPVQITG